MATAATSRALHSSNSEEFPPDFVVFGNSAAMRSVRQTVTKVAGANIPVLIQGPSGAGKEVIARMLHEHSACAAGPFVKLNCAAIPGTLLESELFGYERGAFTGANTSKPGRVELANGGTLFLDEIAEIDFGLQAKLLQLLQDSQFWRIGGREDIHVNVRVICATNRQLEDDIQTGRFRQDLFYRINVVKIQMPHLRDRVEDLPELVRYFLETFAKKYNSTPAPISPNIMRALARHSWPGNIRELRNLVERYAILGGEESLVHQLQQSDYAAESRRAANTNGGAIELKTATRQTVHELEKKIIMKSLAANRWNRKLAAKELQISYRTLLYKIRQCGLPTRRSIMKAGTGQTGTSEFPAD
jgi:two-component system response regulator AtoC